jgi:hypothetical protein
MGCLKMLPTPPFLEQHSKVYGFDSNPHPPVQIYFINLRNGIVILCYGEIDFDLLNFLTTFSLRLVEYVV